MRTDDFDRHIMEELSQIPPAELPRFTPWRPAMDRIVVGTALLTFRGEYIQPLMVFSVMEWRKGVGSSSSSSPSKMVRSAKDSFMMAMMFTGRVTEPSASTAAACVWWATPYLSLASPRSWVQRYAIPPLQKMNGFL